MVDCKPWAILFDKAKLLYLGSLSKLLLWIFPGMALF